jgi:hypothetical protein
VSKGHTQSPGERAPGPTPCYKFPNSEWSFVGQLSDNNEGSLSAFGGPDSLCSL